jgi:hypothetical protein
MGRKRRHRLQLYEVELLSEDDPLAIEFPELKAYEYGECRILRGISKEKGVYLAISCRSRWPTTLEIINIRNLLVARDLEMAVIIPIAPEPGDSQFMFIKSHTRNLKLSEIKRDELLERK